MRRALLSLMLAVGCKSASVSATCVHAPPVRLLNDLPNQCVELRGQVDRDLLLRLKLGPCDRSLRTWMSGLTPGGGMESIDVCELDGHTSLRLSLDQAPGWVGESVELPPDQADALLARVGPLLDLPVMPADPAAAEGAPEGMIVARRTDDGQHHVLLRTWASGADVPPAFLEARRALSSIAAEHGSRVHFEHLKP